MTAYLAGSMTYYMREGRYNEATDWRVKATEILTDAGITIFDPTINSKTHYAYPPEYDGGVILQNHTYLKKCDFVLLNLEAFEDSIGSVWEVSMVWAEHKPVIAFGRCVKWEKRPHFKALMTIILDNVEDACDYILSMYDQKI